MPPDEPDSEENEEELPQDYATPFSLPSDQLNTNTKRPERNIDSTHPSTDTGMQLEELYDQGLSNPD